MARGLADLGRYCSMRTGKAYREWLDSAPFDCGITVANGILGTPTPHSQANGGQCAQGAGRERRARMAWEQQERSVAVLHAGVKQLRNGDFGVASEYFGAISGLRSERSADEPSTMSAGRVWPDASMWRQPRPNRLQARRISVCPACLPSVPPRATTRDNVAAQRPAPPR